jgi:hypothetical protein
MKKVWIQTERLKRKFQTLEFLSDSKTIMGSITCRDMAKELQKDCLRLLGAIGLYEARVHPAPEAKRRIPGSRYERNEYRTRYRCWVCRKFGGDDCINIFLNRPACVKFTPNEVLRRFPERIGKLRNARGNMPPKLKPPIIPEFNQHFISCKVCDRISKGGKDNPVELQLNHYRKVKARKQKKLTVYFGFFGVSYSENYINEWEE